MGIAEQDMVGTASGLALGGMIPFASTYGVFLAGRAWDQIRTTVCYNNLNVKLAGAHAGISVGPDGATHQALEDVALMRVLPNMTVVVPCDAVETEKATLALSERVGPCYIRFGREAVPVITNEDSPFEIGKANVLREGSDAVLFANGAMVYEGLEAAKQLAEEGIDLMVAGGMGSAVAECLVQYCPVPVRMVGVQDSFGESGDPEQLMDKYHLNQTSICNAVRELISK